MKFAEFCEKQKMPVISRENLITGIFAISLPHLAKENIVAQLGKFWGEIAQPIPVFRLFFATIVPSPVLLLIWL